MAYRISIRSMLGQMSQPGDLQRGNTPAVGTFISNGVRVFNVIPSHFDKLDGETVDLVEAGEEW